MKIGGRNVKICCMKLTIAVRVIGCLGLFTSLFKIIILGIAIGVVEQDKVPEKTGAVQQSVLITVMISCWFYLIMSAMLIYASTVKKWVLTVPWLIWEAFGFLAQVISLIIFSVATDAEPKYFIIAILSLVLTVYFWMTVFSALVEWKEESYDQIATIPTDPGSCRVGFDNRGVASKIEIANLSV